MTDSIGTASIVYLDSAPLIYYIQEHKRFSKVVNPIIAAIDSGEKEGVSSYLTLLELMILPFKKDRPDLANQYRTLLLGSPHLRLLGVGEEVAVEAARIRAAYDFRTPDALQLASAKVSGADLFVTNDRRLRRFKEVPMLILSEGLSGQ